ncbi:S-layer homology domain-containing protein [Paenibacillus aurantiacus]|uniref:S-layer homology domain-containing protein n=1 Tax=Paenibacillus aurantiacus TaxID=1936118 RepID=A0ABV5KRV0_9BACL
MKKSLKKHLIMGIATTTILGAAVANANSLNSFVTGTVGSSESPGSSASQAPGTSEAPGASTSQAPGPGQSEAPGTSKPSDGIGGYFPPVVSTTSPAKISSDGATVTGTFGAAGAEITLAGGKISIKIPAGAVASDRTITVTSVKAEDLKTKLPNSFVFGGLAISVELSGEDLLLQPATVTLNDAEAIKKLDPKRLSYFKEENGSWLFRGVIVDAEKGTASFNTNSFSTYALLSNGKVFSDEQSAKWAADYISVALGGNFINGYVDGTFKPNNTITRSEFVQVIVGALGLSEKASTATFADVPATAWYNKALGTAIENKLVQGVAANKFAPEAKISREEVATILGRAFELKATQTTTGSEFKDFAKTHEWAVKGVNAALQAGVISGYQDKTLKPQNSISRAEAVTMIVRALDNIGKVSVK